MRAVASMGFLTSFRARVFIDFVAVAGLAMICPRLHERGLPGFLATPPGVALASLLFVLLGDYIEESGTVRRIRAGATLRALSIVPLGAGVAWSASSTAPAGSPVTMGWCAIAIGGALAAGLAWYDASVALDVRHGQPLRLERVDARGLHLATPYGPVRIPIAAVRGGQVLRSDRGRVATLNVIADASLDGPRSALPWAAATRTHDVLVLTGHQLGLDADALLPLLSLAGQHGGEVYR